MNAFCASVNFDAFIHPAPASRVQRLPETPVQNDPVFREQKNNNIKLYIIINSTLHVSYPPRHI
jgi:hypothetical protein